jgi:hypothetical protein
MTPIALYRINKFVLANPDKFDNELRRWHSEIDPFDNNEDFRVTKELLLDAGSEHREDPVLKILRLLGWDTETWEPPQ